MAGCVLVPGWLCPASPSPRKPHTFSDEMRGDGPWEARGSAPRKCQGCLLLAAVSSPVNGAVVFGAPLALKLVLVSEEKVCKGWRWGSLAERKVWGARLDRCVPAHCPAPALSPRALSGRLRLGLAEQSVLAALAQAVSLTPPGQGEPPAVQCPPLELTQAFLLL